MSDYIPEEVVVEILARLPAKTLIKFTTVCKSWKSLLQSSAFVHTHLSRRNHDTTLLLLKVVDMYLNDYCCLHIPETGESKNLDHHVLLGQPNEGRIGKFHVHGTCNGLVYLSSSSYFPCRAIIWNPSIRRFVNLPMPNDSLEDLAQSHAFGYDMATKDYKVLRISRSWDDPFGNIPCVVEVYSLAKGSWKRLSDDVVPKGYLGLGKGMSDISLLLDGAIHWFRRPFGNRRSHSILIFDMHSETFREMVVPDAITKRSRRTCISRYGESLAIVTLTERKNNPATASVWVMNEYGVTHSWNKLYYVRLEGFHLVYTLTYGLAKNGEIFLTKCGCEPFYMISREAVSFEVVGTWHHVRFISSFVESLVLLGQVDAISY